jgi:hypothetical protein
MKQEPPLRILRNKHTKKIRTVLRQNPNGDMILWDVSGRYRITQVDIKEHWEVFDVSIEDTKDGRTVTVIQPVEMS